MFERQAKSAISQNLYVLRQKFSQLFPHGWDFIVKETPESAWKTVKKYKLTEQKLWYKYTDPEKVLGVRFGVETKHGLYDIDLGSIHDPREQERSLTLLKEELEKWGIVRLFFIQSSSSGGLHLYFHLERPVNTFRLACVMNKAAFDAGLEIKKGQLETFPNTKRYDSLFNGHRLPLQQDSYLLDRDYVPESDRLEDFIAAASWSAAGNDVELLENRLDEAYDWFKAQKNKKRVYSPSEEDREFVEQIEYARREISEGFGHHIQSAIQKGFTATGETNELLLTIAKLGRILHGLSGQRYVEYIRETITSCPGYAQYCRHTREIRRRCEEVARYGEKQWYPYRSRLPKDRPTYKYIKQSLTNKANLNLERQHNAQNRIIQAVATIRQEQGKLPKLVGECKQAIRNVTKELFGMSISDATLRKRSNLPLWHPKYCPANIEPKSEPITKSAPSNSTESSTDVNNLKENSTTELKSKISPEKPPKSETSPASEPSLVIQQKLHSEHQDDKHHKGCATPCHVAHKNDSNLKNLKVLPSQAFQVLCHTLSTMKGNWGDFLLKIFHQLFQRVYCEAIIRRRNLVFVFNGHIGKGTSGLVEKKGEKFALLESIQQNTEVRIQTNQLHSSYFQDYPNQILVYIKPLTNSDDWKGGIAVPIEQLSLQRIENQKKHNF